MKIKNVVEQIIGEMYGDPDIGKTAKKICREYKLKNSHFLKNIMGTIGGLSLMYEDSPAASKREMQKLQELRNAVDALRKSALVAGRVVPRAKLAGGLVAILAEHNIFGALELLELLGSCERIETATPRDPREAMLVGFIRPLCEFWLDCTDEMPKGTFEKVGDRLVPVRGTAAAFVSDALRAAGWEFEADRLSKAFYENTTALQLIFGSDDTAH